MSLELLSAEEAALAVRKLLRLTERCSPAASRFEILRACVWGFSGPNGKVYINRVLGAALPIWGLLSNRPGSSDETMRAELRGALSSLRDAGDLVELSGGYWAPAFTRLVELPQESRMLLVGGVPTGLLPLRHGAIRCEGPHRHLNAVPELLGDALPREALDAWARLPTRALSLQDWAKQLMTSLERVAYTPASTDVFEFYSPATVSPGTPQWKRWCSEPTTEARTVLARRIRIYGAREYRLVEVSAGRIESIANLEGVDVRRLMYALDEDAGKSVRARSTRVKDGTQWLFTSELPRAEQRIFATLGTLTIPNDRPFERRWTFLRQEEQAIEMMRALGIQLGDVRREERA